MTDFSPLTVPDNPLHVPESRARALFNRACREVPCVRPGDLLSFIGQRMIGHEAVSRHFEKILSASGRQLEDFVRRTVARRVDFGESEAPERLVDAWIAAYADGFIETVNRSARSGPTVLFVTTRTDYKPLREAIALRKAGWRCFLLCFEALNPVVLPVFEENVDGLLLAPFSPLLLARMARRLRPTVIHAHCAMWHYHFGVVLLNEAPEVPLVSEFNDITSYFLKYETMIGRWPKDEVDLDLAMERELFRRSALVVHQWDEEIEDSWRACWGGDRPVMTMQPYPLTAWCRSPRVPPPEPDRTQWMVWAGQIPGRLSCPPELFDSYYLGEAVEELLAQGFGVSVFQNPMFCSDFADENLAFYRGLAERFPHFRPSEGVRVDRLSDALQEFDFGLILFAFDPVRSNSPPRRNCFMLPNKLYGYLEAGIPLIVNREFEKLAERVEAWGVGIAVSVDEIGDVHRRVAHFDRNRAAEAIATFQREHSMEREIGRLIAAYRTFASV